MSFSDVPDNNTLRIILIVLGSVTLSALLLGSFIWCYRHRNDLGGDDFEIEEIDEKKEQQQPLHHHHHHNHHLSNHNAYLSIDSESQGQLENDNLP